MRENLAPIRRDAYKQLFVNGAFATLGYWAWVAFPHYWFLGAGLAGLAGLGMLGPLWDIWVGGPFYDDQKTIRREAKKKVYGKVSRLARESDGLIQKMRKPLGVFVAAFHQSLLFYNPWQSGAAHCMVVGPPRTGKSNLLQATLLNLVHVGKKLKFSIWVNDVKGELYWVCAGTMQLIGKRVVVFNYFGLKNVPHTNFNPLDLVKQELTKTTGDCEARDWSAIFAKAMIAEPEGGGGSGNAVFFREGGRALLRTLMVYMAVFEPDHCHLPRLRELVNTGNDLLAMVANKMRECQKFKNDHVNALVRGMGTRLTDNLKAEQAKPGTFGSFRQEAEQATDIYDGSSTFGQRLMKKSTFSLEELFDENTVCFDTTPLTKLGTHGSFKALMATVIIETFARRNQRSKFLMLFDEIGNVGKLPTDTITKALSLLPGLGLRMVTYWQSPVQPAMYGPTLKKMFYDQSSLLQTWQVSDPDFAQEMSRRSGKTTRKKASFSQDPEKRDFRWSKSWDEFEEANLSETEILHLPKHQQIVSVVGEPMIKARKISFWQVRSWRQIAGPNPFETGGYPKEDKIEWD
ncbi:MAG: hypothetical protein NPIRA03_25610 [Nitrospirales bacterium]|nr:MAG: hypothetical protein NPIRA03_25610 [Nitrospirales bacterium]